MDAGGQNPLAVPEGAIVYADLKITETHFHWEALHGEVTVKHYQFPNRLQDYFTMHRDGTGTYHNTINWHDDEITNYGQNLAVCVHRTSAIEGGRKSYTLETYAEVMI